MSSQGFFWKGGRQGRVREGDEVVEAQARMMQLQAKEYRRPLEAGEGRKWILPSILQKEHSSADNLISAQGEPFQNSEPQNCRMITFIICVKLLSRWSWVTAVIGTRNVIELALTTCSSNRFSGDADAAGAGTTLWEPLAFRETHISPPNSGLQVIHILCPLVVWTLKMQVLVLTYLTSKKCLFWKSMFSVIFSLSVLPSSNDGEPLGGWHDKPLKNVLIAF